MTTRRDERALALLGRLLQAAEAEGRAGVQIEGLALQALAQWRWGEPASAITSLERALRLAIMGWMGYRKRSCIQPG